MTFSDWIVDSAERIRSEPINGITRSLYELYLGGLRRTDTLYSGGEHVYERDWDALILLDACRLDLLDEVADEYAFLREQESVTSVGSSSIEWLENTFTEEWIEEMQETAYVTANPFSKRVLSQDDVLVLDEVWRYGWDEDRGTVPARAVTERAIDTGRRHDADRFIVHYMQPHFPSIPQPLTDGMNTDTLGDGEGWNSPWQRLQRGELDRETLWSSYRENLRYVLEDVALLLQNLDADRAIISADHGNASGEWGVYGHPKVPLEPIRTVPWYETEANDTRTYTPELERETSKGELENKLKSLGYL